MNNKWDDNSLTHEQRTLKMYVYVGTDEVNR